MVKWFKLPVIQGSIVFEGFLPGSLRYQISVIPPYKNSIFTMANLVKDTWGKSEKRKYSHFGGKCV